MMVLLVRVFGGAKWGRSAVILLTYVAFATVVSLIAAVSLKRTIADSFHIPTPSMSPAIAVDGRVMVDRMVALKRWDIVVYRRPWEDHIYSIGRLVALPGEQVELVPPGIKINGSLVPFGPDMKSVAYICRPYRSQPSQGQVICNGCGTPVTLGPDEYFFLGDKSVGALDSRYWEPSNGHQAGALTRDRIVGVVRLRYAPFKRIHLFR
jgi:signal peptidase I